MSIDTYGSGKLSGTSFSVESRELEFYRSRIDVLKPTNPPVLIVRDAWNWVASKITQKKKFGNYDEQRKQNIHREIALYKTYLKALINSDEFLGVNYNLWFVSDHYKKTIARKLNLKTIDKGLQKVSSHGSGSSFDGMKFNGNAQEMDVMNRYFS